MYHSFSRRLSRRQLALLTTVIAAVTGLFAFAAAAQASELLYWDNYGGSPDNVAFANIDGSGGGALSTGSQVIESPEGMAYDTVTNRLFVTTKLGANRQILAINLDGSGASPFTAPGAPIEEPEGVAVDPAARMIYWLNTTSPESIAWAKLDGSAGGVLNTAGATLNSACCRIAVDPTGGRIYWVNNPVTSTIAYANLNNTGGGGELNLTGTTVAPGGEGLAVDSAAGRIYFLGGKKIGFANVNGSGGGDVSIGSGVINGTWGLGFDPSSSRLYWGNESNGETRTNAIGFVNLVGAGGGISIATAPVAGPQDPVIIKSPTGTGVPAVTRVQNSRSSLSCSQGSWGADYPGGFVYQAPRTFAYQWTLKGTPVAGATTATLNATKAGSYACVVTAANQVGSASQASAAVNVKAAKLKLTVKKKVKARAGGVATFNVNAVNQGDLKSKSSRICVKVPKKAKKALKAPKCKSLGQLKGRGKHPAKLKIKVGDSASGTYKVTFVVRGGSGKSAKAKILVAGTK